MSASSLTLNLLLLVPCVLAALFLLRSKLVKGDLWRATLTPLSSIIGSGFLIMAPLLASIVGPLAPVAILGIVLLAYAIGHVICFNILHVEPRLADGRLYWGTRQRRSPWRRSRARLGLPIERHTRKRAVGTFALPGFPKIRRVRKPRGRRGR